MVSHWTFEHLKPYIFQLIAWDSHLGWLWHSQKILEDSKWLIWLILNQLRTCFANPPWQTGNWPSWLVSDCLQSKTEASHCGKVCVARNRDNRAIMAEGGLSKSSKYSSAGILNPWNWKLATPTNSSGYNSWGESVARGGQNANWQFGIFHGRNRTDIFISVAS